tara:strand:- start:10929 stop:11642 length:714 start_codon:yes stop_codon:yes gene_type:complete
MKSIFISVRSGSTRLPNKATADICGKPAIEYLIHNLKNSEQADRIVLCTTELSGDDILCNIATKNHIDFFRGNEEDKLLRWQGACEKFGVEMFAECGGDDIFCDYELIDMVFNQYDISEADFIDGHDLYNDVYGMTSAFLNRLCSEKGGKILETHHISKYTKGLDCIYQKLEDTPDKFKKKYRMTLDYDIDLLFFRTIVERLGNVLQFENILNLLDTNPEIPEINFYLEDTWKENQK